MGASLAQAAYALGAEVHLVLGPTQKTFNLSGISVYHVISAAEMWEAMKTKFSEADLTICSAAVADYRPQIQQVAKIKKENQSSEELEIKLVHNRDILKSLGEIKTAEQYLVGFALETENGAANARAKLIRKNADAIILNELGKKGVGFESETNEVNVYFKEGSTKSFDLQEKRTLAHQLLSLFIREFQL
jgi:phosphopantothenoylcysteine decarboxylase/phosphopantothenate--cysteine ligase